MYVQVYYKSNANEKLSNNNISQLCSLIFLIKLGYKLSLDPVPLYKQDYDNETLGIR